MPTEWRLSILTSISNIMSGAHAYSEQLKTVGDAVQFAKDIIENNQADLFELAKDLCEDINTGMIVTFD